MIGAETPTPQHPNTPTFEEGEVPMVPLQWNMCSHVADDACIVPEALKARIGGVASGW